MRPVVPRSASVRIDVEPVLFHLHARVRHEGPRLGDIESAEVNGGQVVAHLVRSVPAILGVAEPELPVDILAPALHAAVVQLRAIMVGTGSDELGRPTRPQVNRG